MKRTAFFLMVVFGFLFVFEGLCLAQIGKAKDFQGEFADPGIFLRPLKSVGRTNGTTLYFADPGTSCGDVAPLDRCFVLPDPGAALSWNEQAIESLVIPAGSLRDLLVLGLQNNITIALENSTASDDIGRLKSRVTVTIESPVFDGVTDPSTGTPLNGQWIVGFGQRRVLQTLRSGDVHTDQINYSRILDISRGLLKNNLALTDAQVDQFFGNPISLRMNMDGLAKYATSESGASVFLIIEGY